MKQLWLVLTACGLFLLMGSAGALELDRISWVQLILQLLAAGGLLYLGQWLHKKQKAKARTAAKRKAAAAKASFSGKGAAPSKGSYHQAA